MFLVIILIIQMGFATAFLVRFRVFSSEYAFIGKAVLSLFRVLFGDFDFEIYKKTDLENMAPFFIAVYGFIMYVGLPIGASECNQSRASVRPPVCLSVSADERM
jgi:hypothetical protein